MSEQKPVNVYLEGKLGKLFGREWKLFVNSPGEALRAIDINLKGKLKQYLANEGAKKYYKIAVQKKDNLIDVKEEINNRSGSGDIYIIPTIKGSSGGLKVVAGVILVIIGVILAYTPAAAFSTPVIEAGVSLIIGGVVQLLTPVPKIQQDSSSADQRASSIFQGNSTTITQGSSVGIVYGHALVAPMPISMSMDNVDIGTNAIIPITYPTVTTLGNGSSQIGPPATTVDPNVYNPYGWSSTNIPHG